MNPPDIELNLLRRRHFVVGWIGITIFLALGIGLEALHAVKWPFYLDARNTTRRLMWTLAHAHGTLFSILQIAFAVTLSSFPQLSEKSLRWISRGLIGALVVMPLGFLLGGLDIHGGDPGWGILLVPIGALFLLASTIAFVRLLLKPPKRS